MAKAKIVTQYVHPPIPDRRFDWAAYREDFEPADSDGVGQCGHYGTGPTEEAAIADLLEQEEEEA